MLNPFIAELQNYLVDTALLPELGQQIVQNGQLNNDFLNYFNQFTQQNSDLAANPNVSETVQGQLHQSLDDFHINPIAAVQALQAYLPQENVTSGQKQAGHYLPISQVGMPLVDAAVTNYKQRLDLQEIPKHLSDIQQLSAEDNVKLDINNIDLSSSVEKSKITTSIENGPVIAREAAEPAIEQHTLRTEHAIDELLAEADANQDTLLEPKQDIDLFVRKLSEPASQTTNIIDKAAVVQTLQQSHKPVVANYQELNTVITEDFLQVDNDFSSKLTDKIQLMVQNHKNEATINLEPAELGQIDVVIKLNKNQDYTINITTSNENTQQLFENNADKLKQAFADTEVNFNFSQQQQQSQQNSSNDNNEKLATLHTLVPKHQVAESPYQIQSNRSISLFA